MKRVSGIGSPTEISPKSAKPGAELDTNSAEQSHDGSTGSETGSIPQGGATATDVLPPEGLDELRKRKREIKLRLENKKERLRKLQMVKMYRTKNDLDQLSRLIVKWREVVRDGLLELHDSNSDPRPTLTQLVDHFQLDHALIGYNPEEEGFDDD